jgi:uncharacterized membrane protein
MAVAFALFTSVAYGVSNYVGPRLARDAPLLVLLIAGQGCAFVLAVAIVVAQAEAAPPAGELAAALLAGVGNAGGLLLFYRAAAVGPLSIVTPIGAVGAAVPVAVGVARGEAMTALKAAGIVLALSGLVLVARRTRAGAAAAADVGDVGGLGGDGEPPEPARRPAPRRRAGRGAARGGGGAAAAAAGDPGAVALRRDAVLRGRDA